MSDTALKIRNPVAYDADKQPIVANDDAPLRSFFAKRVFDVIGAFVALILLAPALLIVAAILKIKHPNVPILYGNLVVGKDGRPFSMWKFSTMRADAHLVLENILREDESMRSEWEQNVKLQKDPRILPGFGNFLRRSSLNELPQFYNVLAGDMSLVGPRPITKPEEAIYLRIGGPEMLARRHAQRPGITGLWQATARSDISYEERVGIDDKYLKTQNFVFDLQIICWTVKKVISREGAV